MAISIQTDGSIIRDARDRYRRRAEDGAHGAFDAEIRRSGETPKTVVTVKREGASARIAGLLDVEPGTEVSVRVRRMFAGEKLVQLADSYIPVDVATAAGIEQVDTGAGGIISRMAEAGFAQDDLVEEIRQIEATVEQAEALGVAAGDKLIEITHFGYSGERLVEVTVHTLGPGWTLRYGVPLA